MNHLRESLSQSWHNIQGSLFPWLQEELGLLTRRQQLLVTILEVIRMEEHLSNGYGGAGRPLKNRVAIARAFVAKMTFNLPTTRALIDRLESDIKTRRICGWERLDELPGESTFSRAFAEYSEQALPQRIHEALILNTHQELIVGHISRDSTAIPAREKPEAKKQAEPPGTKKKRGRPRKGEERTPEPTRLQKQPGMSLEEMLNDLPGKCNVGTKKNSKGYKESWTGYKLHIDATDRQIPVSCILTSASLHDSLVAIPLATQTHQRVTNLYDLMDAAYDVGEIKAHSESLGHVPIIDINPRRDKALKKELQEEAQRRYRAGFVCPTDQRYHTRSTVERVNGRLKDEFGGRMVRVRGHAKVACHLMFGIVALTADQLMRFVT